MRLHSVLGHYLLMQFVVNTGYGILFGLGIWLIGIPHGLLWGVLGGLLRFVPYIGTPVAAAFQMGMALAVSLTLVGIRLTMLKFAPIVLMSSVRHIPHQTPRWKS